MCLSTKRASARYMACRSTAASSSYAPVDKVRTVDASRHIYRGSLPEDVVQAFDRVSDGIVMLDQDWRYAYLNESAARMFGRRRDELVGRHIWTEFPEGRGQPFH